MSNRQGGPTSNPADQLARTLNNLGDCCAENARAVARGALPEPLTWRVTNVAPGPPPTFQVEILNPLTGASINLGTI